MTCSPAQLESNRRNAQLSTGPTYHLGKMRSRANGFKHGLTGKGIVLPTEDAEELDRRFDTLRAEMNPRSEVTYQLVSRVALMTVRLDRSAEHEARAIAHRMRKAAAEHDDARLAEVEKYYSWIAAEPATNTRRLRKSPEGIDRLIGAFEELRSDLAHPQGMRWGWLQCDQLHHLMGRRQSDVPVSRARALIEATAANFEYLDQTDGAGLDQLNRQLWALGTLVDLIDGEIAKHKALRESFDREGLELDRSEAAARAMFDASPEAVLARKYEAASERNLYRALREFREIQAQIPKVEAAPQLAAEPLEELGSCLPEPPGEDIEEADVDPIVPGEGPAKTLRVDRAASNDRSGAFVQVEAPRSDPLENFPGKR
jgi:hypothetical protein